MKKSEYIVLGLAGLALLLIVKGTGAARPAVRGANFQPKATAADQGFGNLVATWEGWRYYDSGYGRGPDGAVYFQGEKVTG